MSAGAILYGNPGYSITPTGPTPYSGYLLPWLSDDKPCSVYKDADNSIALTWDAGAGNTMSAIGFSIHNIQDLQADANSYIILASSPDAAAWTTRLTMRAAASATMPTYDEYVVNTTALTYRALRITVLAKAGTYPAIGELRLWSSQLTFTKDFNWGYRPVPELECYTNDRAATFGQINQMKRQRYSIGFVGLGETQFSALQLCTEYNPVLFIPDTASAAGYHGAIKTKVLDNAVNGPHGRDGLSLEFQGNAVMQAART
jgi:hypothetical protein